MNMNLILKPLDQSRVHFITKQACDGSLDIFEHLYEALAMKIFVSLFSLLLRDEPLAGRIPAKNEITLQNKS